MPSQDYRHSRRLSRSPPISMRRHHQGHRHDYELLDRYKPRDSSLSNKRRRDSRDDADDRYIRRGRVHSPPRRGRERERDRHRDFNYHERRVARGRDLSRDRSIERSREEWSRRRDDEHSVRSGDFGRRQDRSSYTESLRRRDHFREPESLLHRRHRDSRGDFTRYGERDQERTRDRGERDSLRRGRPVYERDYDRHSTKHRKKLRHPSSRRGRYPGEERFRSRSPPNGRSRSPCSRESRSPSRTPSSPHSRSPVRVDLSHSRSRKRDHSPDNFDRFANDRNNLSSPFYSSKRKQRRISYDSSAPPGTPERTSSPSGLKGETKLPNGRAWKLHDAEGGSPTSRSPERLPPPPPPPPPLPRERKSDEPPARDSSVSSRETSKPSTISAVATKVGALQVNLKPQHHSKANPKVPSGWSSTYATETRKSGAASAFPRGTNQASKAQGGSKSATYSWQLNAIISPHASATGATPSRAGSSRCPQKSSRFHGGIHKSSPLSPPPPAPKPSPLPPAPTTGYLDEGAARWRDSRKRIVLTSFKTRPRVEDTYSHENQVGEGTYAKVYKALDKRTGAVVALKRIKIEVEKDGFPITAMREIRLLSLLDHKNVVKLQDLALGKGHVYMVFEYMDYDLTGLLAHPDVDLAIDQVKCLTRQLFTGLGYLHKSGILHRDIKGSNLLLNARGELKLADFGLARALGNRINAGAPRWWNTLSSNKELTNRVITLWYRSPELLLGSTSYSFEVDIWSAGCIMGELLHGRPLFQGTEEITQLDAIFDLCGTPDVKDWPEITELQWYPMLAPKVARQSKLRSVIGERPGSTVDLLCWLLELRPSKRPTCAQTLRHKFFSEEPRACELLRLPKLSGDWHEFEMKSRRKKGPQGKDLPSLVESDSKQSKPDEATTSQFGHRDAGTTPVDEAVTATELAWALPQVQPLPIHGSTSLVLETPPSSTQEDRSRFGVNTDTPHSTQPRAKTPDGPPNPSKPNLLHTASSDRKDSGAAKHQSQPTGEVRSAVPSTVTVKDAETLLSRPSPSEDPKSAVGTKSTDNRKRKPQSTGAKARVVSVMSSDEASLASRQDSDRKLRRSDLIQEKASSRKRRSETELKGPCEKSQKVIINQSAAVESSPDARARATEKHASAASHKSAPASLRRSQSSAKTLPLAASKANGKGKIPSSGKEPRGPSDEMSAPRGLRRAPNSGAQANRRVSNALVRENKLLVDGQSPKTQGKRVQLETAGDFTDVLPSSKRKTVPHSPDGTKRSFRSSVSGKTPITADTKLGKDSGSLVKDPKPTLHEGGRASIRRQATNSYRSNKGPSRQCSDAATNAGPGTDGDSFLDGAKSAKGDKEIGPGGEEGGGTSVGRAREARPSGTQSGMNGAARQKSGTTGAAGLRSGSTIQSVRGTRPLSSGGSSKQSRKPRQRTPREAAGEGHEHTQHEATTATLPRRSTRSSSNRRARAHRDVEINGHRVSLAAPDNKAEQAPHDELGHKVPSDVTQIPHHAIHSRLQPGTEMSQGGESSHTQAWNLRCSRKVPQSTRDSTRSGPADSRTCHGHTTGMAEEVRQLSAGPVPGEVLKTRVLSVSEEHLGSETKARMASESTQRRSDPALPREKVLRATPESQRNETGAIPVGWKPEKKPDPRKPAGSQPLKIRLRLSASQSQARVTDGSELQPPNKSIVQADSREWSESLPLYQPAPSPPKCHGSPLPFMEAPLGDLSEEELMSPATTTDRTSVRSYGPLTRKPDPSCTTAQPAPATHTQPASSERVIPAMSVLACESTSAALCPTHSGSSPDKRPARDLSDILQNPDLAERHSETAGRATGSSLMTYSEPDFLSQKGPESGQRTASQHTPPRVATDIATTPGTPIRYGGLHAAAAPGDPRGSLPDERTHLTPKMSTQRAGGRSRRASRSGSSSFLNASSDFSDSTASLSDPDYSSDDSMYNVTTKKQCDADFDDSQPKGNFIRAAARKISASRTLPRIMQPLDDQKSPCRDDVGDRAPPRPFVGPSEAMHCDFGGTREALFEDSESLAEESSSAPRRDAGPKISSSNIHRASRASTATMSSSPDIRPTRGQNSRTVHRGAYRARLLHSDDDAE